MRRDRADGFRPRHTPPRQVSDNFKQSLAILYVPLAMLLNYISHISSCCLLRVTVHATFRRLQRCFLIENV